MSLKSYWLCTRMRTIPLCLGEKYLCSQHAGSREISILNSIALHDLELAFEC